jgi:hypothetical protein
MEGHDAYQEWAGMADRVLRERLRRRVEESLYPEFADHLEAVERAIVLLVCGMGDRDVTEFNGSHLGAAALVAVLGLEDLADARCAYVGN